MKRLCSIVFLSTLLYVYCPAIESFAYEPAKRLTAMEIYHALLFFPVGGNISEVYKNAGNPVFEDKNIAVYEHNRTRDPLFLKKTPFDMIEAVIIVEKCRSIDDLEARNMLITEQFKRRFGYPFKQDNSGIWWNIQNLVVSISTSPSGQEFSPAMIYQSFPKVPAH